MIITRNKNGKPRKMKYNWHLLDWKRPNTIICREIGASHVTVSQARAKYAPETVSVYRMDQLSKTPTK